MEILPFLCRIPWGQNRIIVSKIKDIEEALYYVQQTIKNNWSRSLLDHQIDSKLYHREGKSITNFQTTLPKPQSDLAIQTLKDPYVFDFLTIGKEAHERELEKALVKHITRFLLELGKGFAFVGQQYHLEIEDADYYIDLLFYHLKLRCYVVVELKTTGFKPEYAGKLNFYLSAVDDIIKADDDNPTIGLVLCKEKKNLTAEYSLRDINKPTGISEYQLTAAVPEKLKGSLPSIEEIEVELASYEENSTDE